MSWALAQAPLTNNSTGAASIGVTGTFSDGSLVVVFAASFAGGFDPSKVNGPIIDTAGNLWEPIGGTENGFASFQTSGQGVLGCFFCRSMKPGSSTITAYFTSSPISIQVREYTGGDATCFDNFGYVVNSTADPLSVTVPAIETDGSLCVGAMVFDGNIAMTPAASTGFANAVVTPANGDNITHQAMASSDRLSQISGSNIALTPLTNPSTANSACVVLVFKPAGVGLGIQVRRRAIYESAAVGTTTPAVTLPGVLNGSMIIVGVMGDSITSVKDQHNNTLTPTTHSPANSGLTPNQMGIYYRTSQAAEDVTITCTIPSSGGHFQMCAMEVASLSAFELDTAAGTGTGTTINTPSITTTGASDFLYELMVVGKHLLFAGNGWILSFDSLVGNGDAYMTKKGPGTYPANGIQDISDGWGTIIAAFKGAVNPTGPFPTFRPDLP